MDWQSELAEKASHPDPGNARHFGGSGGKANGKTAFDDLLKDALTEALDAYTWASLDVPPEVKLLGDLIVPGSRTLLVGSTGLGKTMLVYELVGAMASGNGTLGLQCDKPSRWLIIDGEMPTSLIKKRIAETLGRHSPPKGSIIIYSVGRAEELDRLIPGIGEMPPLNTPQGHEWVMRVAKLLEVDGVAFDNLMSLSPGNHIEPEAWAATEPLVLMLSKAGMAQLWLDHTGWNTERGYGSNTKGWKMDAVGMMKPLPEDQRVEREIALTLSFEPPGGKCRRRTPDNWRDFETRTVRFADGKWSSEAATESCKPLTKEGEGWLRDLKEMFRTPGLAEERTVLLPGSKMLRHGVLTLTREQVREGYRRCGRIGEGASEPLTSRDRVALNKRLNELKDRGKIGIADDKIWLE